MLELLLFILVLFYFCWDWFKTIVIRTPDAWCTLHRDITIVTRVITYNLYIIKWYLTGESMVDAFRKSVKKHTEKRCLVGINGTIYTYEQLDAISNKIAKYFISQGFKKGDVISLIMESSPEYIALWLGMAKVGIIASLQNTNTKGSQLLHAVSEANSKAIITSYKFINQVVELDFSLKQFLYWFDYDDQEHDFKNFIVINDFLQKFDSSQIQYNNNILKPNFNDILMYIFTSGSTGLPKAVKISHRKWFFFGSQGWIMDIKSCDIIYSFLPLYHVNSGIVVVANCFLRGSTLIIREKYSSTNFVKDCVNNKVTIFNYVGEICRYLLNIPVSEMEKELIVNRIFGNGLRSEYWEPLKRRFGIKQIVEFYGSTEGNVGMINLDGKPGSCGYIPIWLMFLIPTKLVKCDLTTGEIYRDSDGRCIECDFDEPGHIIGGITKFIQFYKVDGYTRKEATEDKIIRDCFRKDDQYFMSGDILMKDRHGYFYFIDRLGDTYRWKGENVSSLDVETTVSKTLPNLHVVVFGVKVPNMEGSAGMLVIEDEAGTFDTNMLSKCYQDLPSYQQPIFVRVVKHLEKTSTFKYVKKTLKQEGYDVKIISDPLYFYDAKTRKFLPMNEEILFRIEDGSIAL